jgi:phosphopantothenoylcysteine decarboxylase/phosphopantothenate--cysteine ligase
MAEPEEILDCLESFFQQDHFFKNKKILITAGPSQEDIDPVRYISNHSSGKMGYEIAHLLAKKGAKVCLVSGPTALTAHQDLDFVKVRSAQEFYEAVKSKYKDYHIFIFAAAIADYKPKVKADQKIKKKDSEMTIELSKTIDVASEFGRLKTVDKTHIGFALETNNEMENAMTKLEKKNFDMVILNSLNDPGAGFQHDTNKISIISKNNERQEFSLKSKKEVAEDIVSAIKNYLQKSK